MDNHLTIEDFVSYAHYQQQFSQVFSKYSKVLKEESFKTQTLTNEQEKLVQMLLDNFSKNTV